MFRFLGFIVGAVLVSALLLNAARNPDGMNATAEAAKRFLALPPADPTDPAPPRDGFDASKVVDQIAKVIAAVPDDTPSNDEPAADTVEPDTGDVEAVVETSPEPVPPQQTASVAAPRGLGGFWDEAAPLEDAGEAPVATPEPGPSPVDAEPRPAPEPPMVAEPAPTVDPMTDPMAAPSAAAPATAPATADAALPDFTAPPPGDDWHVIWTPFRSELSAKGFAQHLGQTTGYRFRVLRAGPGQYRVAVASAAGADPSESFRAIEAATGLALPGGTL